MSCPLRKCQGKRGCLCPSKPPPFVYSKKTDKPPSVQEPIPVTPFEFKRKPPKYIGENAPDTGPITRVKNNPKKFENNRPVSPKTIPPVKAITAKLPQSEAKFDLRGEDEQKNEEKAESKKTDIVEVVDDIRNGPVQINYNHYKKQFLLVDGSIAADVIDKEYSLSFAFPKCLIHLSKYSPSSYAYEEMGLSSAPLEEENPVGTFQKLKKTTVYWVHVEEDKEEYAAYLERVDTRGEEAAAKRQANEEKEALNGLIQTNRAESCSCIEGNPCMDRYGCKNWENRYEIAKKNGWKGF